jgi:integrase
MAKVHFLLKRPKDVIPSLILLVYRCADGKLVYSMKESVLPSEWDKTKQMPKIIKGRADLSELRFKLKTVALHIDGFIRKEFNNNKQVLIQSIRNELDMYFDLSPINLSVRKFIEHTFLKNKNADNVVLTKVILGKLEELIPDITFSQITPEFFDKLHQSLRNKGFTKNTINIYLNGVLRIIRAANINEDIPISKKLIKKKADIPGVEKVRKAVLSVDEIMKIYHCQLDNEQDRHIRDIFVLMSFIGIRVKDARGTGGVNFENMEFYVKDTSKTGAKIIVPQHYIVKEIIQRYGGYRFPENISSPKVNARLKTIAKAAGINSKFAYSITKGGERQYIEKEKWECISSHTARRSFATNIHKAGIPPAVAMKFTGHKSIQQYMDYIQISEQEAADEYLNHPFFTGGG